MNPLRFAPDCRFTLPQQRCCNCGSVVGRQSLELEAPVPSSGLPDRARRYLLLSVPVCAAPGCVQSLKRQPWSWFALTGLGVLLGLLGFLIWMRLHPSQPIREIGGLSGFAGSIGVGVLIAVAMRWLRRPQKPQTSAFAPVRIGQLVVVGDEVARLRLHFTHADYARDFAVANAANIASGKVAGRQVSGR